MAMRLMSTTIPMMMTIFSSNFMTRAVASFATRTISSSSASFAISSSSSSSLRRSVSGVIYENDSNEDGVLVELYTKEGCTLCDKVCKVLESVREREPHRLEAVDITDEDKVEFWDKYKWDIPVLHVNGLYWTKHRLSEEDALDGLGRARAGTLELPMRGEPDAAAMERRQAERERRGE